MAVTAAIAWRENVPDSYRETLARLVIGWLLRELANGIRDGEMWTADEIYKWLVRYDRQAAAQRFAVYFQGHEPEEPHG